MCIKIFISSRLEELKEERAAVAEAIEELQKNKNMPYKPWMWENESKNMPIGHPTDKVQSGHLKDSRVFTLIVGAEYGCEDGLSPSHKEYTEAVLKIDKDCILVYVKNDEKTVRNRDEKLNKFLESIKPGITYKKFENTEELGLFVRDRLTDLWMNKFKQVFEASPTTTPPDRIQIIQNLLEFKDISESVILGIKNSSDDIEGTEIFDCADIRYRYVRKVLFEMEKSYSNLNQSPDKKKIMDIIWATKREVVKDHDNQYKGW